MKCLVTVVINPNLIVDVQVRLRPLHLPLLKDALILPINFQKFKEVVITIIRRI
jgi:hypothetical protein